MAKPPSLVDVLDRWPIFEVVALDRMGKNEIDRMFTWSIGEDWKSVKIDYVPERIMRRINLAVPLDADPMDTFIAIKEEWTRYLLDQAVEQGKRH